MCHDIGFIPVDRPGHEGSGSLRTSSLLIEELSKHHDITVYVFSTDEVDQSKLPAADRADYFINDNLCKYPEPKSSLIKSINSEKSNLNSHDLVHSYSTNGIVGLKNISAPSLVTLNGYGPVCPKRDLLWENKKKCSGHSINKCTKCIFNSTLDGGKVSKKKLKNAFKRIYRIRVVNQMGKSFDDINHFHALSPHIKEDFANLGVGREKITTIPHFYDGQFYSETPEKATEENHLELLYVGSITKMKGVEFIIKSLPKLIRRYEKIRVRIVGSGPDKKRIQKQAADLGVNDKIIWEGYVPHPELPQIYGNADIFVYPGLWDEPFGRVLLEALASKTPIVGSNVGSVEYITGDAGSIYEPGNPDELSSSVCEVIENYDTYVDATNSEISKFEKNNVLDQFHTLYNSII